MKQRTKHLVPWRWYMERFIRKHLFEPHLHHTQREDTWTMTSASYIYACGVKFIGTFHNNDVMKVCISLRLGTNSCHPFRCHCKVEVAALDRHWLHCKRNSGKFFWPAELNRILHQSLALIYMSSQLKLTALCIDDDSKRSDGITYTAWESSTEKASKVLQCKKIIITSLHSPWNHWGLGQKRQSIYWRKLVRSSSEQLANLRPNIICSRGSRWLSSKATPLAYLPVHQRVYL